MKRKNKKPIIVSVFSTCLFFIPIIIATLVEIFVKSRKDLFELILTAFGFFYLIMFFIRLMRRIRKDKDIKDKQEKINFKELEDKKYFRIVQYVTYYSAILLILIGQIYFCITFY